MLVLMYIPFIGLLQTCKQEWFVDAESMLSGNESCISSRSGFLCAKPCLGCSYHRYLNLPLVSVRQWSLSKQGIGCSPGCQVRLLCSAGL